MVTIDGKEKKAATLQTELANAITETEGVENKTLGDDEVEIDKTSDKLSEVVDATVGLESIYACLSNMRDNGEEFTASHAKLTACSINLAVGRLGGSVGNVVPSLETDNMFLMTDINASMEGIGASIAAGLKAAVAAFLAVLKKVKEWIKAKLSDAGAYIDKQIAKLRSKPDTGGETQTCSIYAHPQEEGFDIAAYLESTTPHVIAMLKSLLNDAASHQADADSEFYLSKIKGQQALLAKRVDSRIFPLEVVNLTEPRRKFSLGGDTLVTGTIETGKLITTLSKLKEVTKLASKFDLTFLESKVIDPNLSSGDLNQYKYTLTALKLVISEVTRYTLIKS